MKYLLIGKNGQLGKEFIKVFSERNYDFVALGHNQIELADIDQCFEKIKEIKPDIVINTSAYNYVDLAEKNYDIAFKTNAFGIHNLVKACEKNNILIVHYSTDYVFDGLKENGLYTEKDIPNPLSQYGRSKYMGEGFLNEYDNHLLFRVSWVFGQGEQNFIYKFIQWVNNNNILKISGDEVSVPTSTKTIVEVTLKALENNLRGLYHLTNQGYCSRYEYAKFICDCLKLENIIYPVSMNSFNLPAKRPGFSPMSNKKIKADLAIEIDTWQKALTDYLKL